jgi:DNA-directed RNA polymerase specialized sigma24 family protein
MAFAAPLSISDRENASKAQSRIINVLLHFHAAIDFLDRQKRSPSVLFSDVPESILQNVQAATHTDGVQLLQKFIESLTAADREIFGMYLNDFSYRDISKMTGLGENCLRMRISRIKRKFEERHIES